MLVKYLQVTLRTIYFSGDVLSEENDLIFNNPGFTKAMKEKTS